MEMTKGIQNWRSIRRYKADPIPEAALETIPVQKSKEELEVLLLTIMGSGRHQEEMTRQGGKELTEFVSLGVFDLAAEERGRQFVRLIANHQIPAAIRGSELLLHVFVSGELIEPGNDEVVLHEPVAGPCGL